MDSADQDFELDNKNIKGLQNLMVGQRLFINYAYYFGLIPCYMDSKFIVRKMKSSLEWIRYMFTINIIIMLNSLLLIRWMYTVYVGEFQLNSTDNIVYLVNTVCIGTGSFFHLHTLWKYKEMITCINAFNKLISTNSYFDFSGKRTKIQGIIIRLLFWACVGLCSLSIFVFLTKCQWHFYSQIMPICEPEFSAKGDLIGWHHGSVELIPIKALMAWFAFSSSLVGCFLYVSLIFPVTLTGKDLFDHLGIHDPSNHFGVHQNWTKLYRSLQLMFVLANEALQDAYSPGMTLAVLSAIVLINYVLIRIELGVFATAYFLLFDVFLIMALLLVYGRFVNMVGGIRANLVERKNRMQGKFYKADLAGLAPMFLEIGTTHHLDEETRIIAFSAVQDWTLNLLMLN